MAKTVHLKPVTDAEAWTPCWSAHAYGWDNSWWRESTLDGERCQCSAEKIAHNRELGREIMEVSTATHTFGCRCKQCMHPRTWEKRDD